jgi:hypothetical protein
VDDFVEIVKPLHKILKKEIESKMTLVHKEAFKNVKSSIVVAPTLHNPYFNKDFSLYTFVSDHFLVAVLTEKDEQGNECLMSFISTSLQGDKLKYPVINKQAFIVYKVVK